MDFTGIEKRIFFNSRKNNLWQREKKLKIFFSLPKSMMNKNNDEF